MFNRVAFIGIGLIGSSMARVMKRDKLAGTIVACARRLETLDVCLKRRCNSKGDALRLEAAIKRLSREAKERLIARPRSVASLVYSRSP